MRRIREILRLCLELGLSQPKIAESMRISSSTVNRLVLRAKAAKLSWPLPEELDDAALEKLLYPPTKGRSQSRPEPDWNHVHEQLKLKGVTLSLLWQEYKEQHPDGYQMSQFFDRYRDWRAKLNISMRQVHRAGQKAFSDFAGAKFQLIDRETGVVTYAHLFVSVLGASNYTFAEVFHVSSPSLCRMTKRIRSSKTELSFHGIHSRLPLESAKVYTLCPERSVTYVFGPNN